MEDAVGSVFQLPSKMGLLQGVTLFRTFSVNTKFRLNPLSVMMFLLARWGYWWVRLWSWIRVPVSRHRSMHRHIVFMTQ